MLRSRLLPVVLGLVLAAGVGQAVPPPMRVLVTNDDGVAAAGIDALVEELRGNPQLAVTVAAPATNQSGTGDQVTAPPDTIATTAATTASGAPATAVAGFPADSVLVAVLATLPERPDLVVSGINAGQNVADAVPISGTIGAARWAARLGIPAIAASAQFGTTDYGVAAGIVGRLVEHVRRDRGLRKHLREAGPDGHGIVLNVNVPNCPGGGRGMRLVTVGRIATPTGYALVSDVGGVRTWSLAQATLGYNDVDCASTQDAAANDLEAFLAGFVTVTPLSDEGQVSSRTMKQLKVVTKAF